MEIKELQKEANNIVLTIDSKLGAEHNAETTLIHLIEEFGELARQHNNKSIRKIEQDKSNIEEEFADILMLLMRLANIYNINMEDVLINKIAKLKERHKL